MAGKSKATPVKGADKGKANDKGKGKSKATASDEKAPAKQKGAQSVNVRHILVCLPLSLTPPSPITYTPSSVSQLFQKRERVY